MSEWIKRASPYIARFFRIVLVAGGFGLAILYFWVGTWPAVKVFLCLGAALNLVALTLNNGFMLVRLRTVPRQYESLYKSIDSRTRFWFLGDWIRVGRYYASPGDLCLAAALVVHVAGALAEQWTMLSISLP